MYIAPMQGDPVLGTLIRSVREAREETLEDAAASVGCSRSHLNNIELGIKGAGRELLFRISSHYEISLDDFIAAAEGKPIKRAAAKLTPFQAVVVEIMQTMTADQVRALVNHLLASYKPKRN
jgi:transcriptional regulator with XRE-family HTH domain